MQAYTLCSPFSKNKPGHGIRPYHKSVRQARPHRETVTVVNTAGIYEQYKSLILKLAAVLKAVNTLKRTDKRLLRLWLVAKSSPYLRIFSWQTKILHCQTFSTKRTRPYQQNRQNGSSTAVNDIKYGSARLSDGP